MHLKLLAKILLKFVKFNQYNFNRLNLALNQNLQIEARLTCSFAILMRAAPSE